MSLAQFILAKAAAPASRGQSGRINIKDMLPDALLVYRRQYIRKHNGKKSPRRIAMRIGMTEEEMQAFSLAELGEEVTSVKFWNSDRIAKLKKLAGTMPKAELARELGTSVYGIHKQAAKMKINLAFRRKMGVLDESNKKTIILMKKAGHGCPYIAKRVGLSHGTVWKFAKSKGISMSSTQPWDEEDLAIACHAWADDVAIKHIAHYLGRTYGATARRIGRVKNEDPALWEQVMKQKPLASSEDIEAKYLADFGKL